MVGRICGRQELSDYVSHCASVLAKEGVNARTHLYAGRWHKAPADNETVSLTAHLTGCMLIEAKCLIDKQ